MKASRMTWGWYHKILCIFGDIDRKGTRKTDLEISWAVFEKHDLILHLNVILRGGNFFLNLLFVNGWRHDR